jgi:hypothetical protein
MPLFAPNENYTMVIQQAKVAADTVSSFWTSFYRDNEKRKRDPFTPALRSKGEKARNRSKRSNRK